MKDLKQIGHRIFDKGLKILESSIKDFNLCTHPTSLPPIGIRVRDLSEKTKADNSAKEKLGSLIFENI